MDDAYDANDGLVNPTNGQTPTSFPNLDVPATTQMDWREKGDSDGDGVTDDQEVLDGTNPLDPCSFILASATLSPNAAWNAADCDGDGVTDGTEVADRTNPLDPCSFILASATLSPNAAWNAADCDGDGITNGKEVTDGTNPLDPCSFILASATLPPSAAWNAADCDGDGVTNGKEVADGNNPLDPCSPNTCDVFIPDGFSPNGDGTHDVFVITGLGMYPKHKFLVFNRWGNKVYEASPYTNTWNGTNMFGISFGGEELPVGTYFYIFETGVEGKKAMTGYIYLNR